MSELQAILSNTVSRLFSEQVTRDVRQSAEDGIWPADLWQLVEDHGLTLPQIPEAQGGAGGSWLDAAVVLTAAGRFAVPLPLAETMVAAWLLSRAGLDVPAGPLTIAPVHPAEQLELTRSDSGWRLSGTATRVPWGRAAGHVVVVAGDAIALAPGGATADLGVNLAREPRDTLSWRDAAVTAAPSPAVPAGAVQLFGALVRSAQIAGALEYLLAQTLQHVTERQQFGRPLGKFQVIRHQLAELAGHVAAASIAAANAFRAADRADSADPQLEIAVAKTRTGEAAGRAAAIAHQCHGAIGLTYEHALHYVTRRLWSWRAEFGSERAWALRVGQSVAGASADALWSQLTSR